MRAAGGGAAGAREGGSRRVEEVEEEGVLFRSEEEEPDDLWGLNLAPCRQGERTEAYVDDGEEEPPRSAGELVRGRRVDARAVRGLKVS